MDSLPDSDPLPNSDSDLDSDSNDSPPTAPRLPIELCEHIIESIYSERFYLVSSALLTLSRCSLVCRAWRPRAQAILFTYVLLKDTAALHRFAALLARAPHLGRYVRTLSLRGHHHRADSTVVLFPTVLRDRLPSLVRLSIAEAEAEPEHAQRETAASLPAGTGTDTDRRATGQKKPPCLPIHPRFPALMAKFAHIRELNLSNTTFPSFGDLCRVLAPLTGLREILALSVSYGVLGLLPQCVLKNVIPGASSKRFLPELRALLVSCVYYSIMEFGEVENSRGFMLPCCVVLRHGRGGHTAAHRSARPVAVKTVGQVPQRTHAAAHAWRPRP